MSDVSQTEDPSNRRWFQILTTVVELLAGLAGVTLFIISNDWSGKMLGALMMFTGLAQIIALGIVLARKRKARRTFQST